MHLPTGVSGEKNFSVIPTKNSIKRGIFSGIVIYLKRINDINGFRIKLLS